MASFKLRKIACKYFCEVSLLALSLLPLSVQAQVSYSLNQQSPHNESYSVGSNFSCPTCHTSDGVTGSYSFFSNLFLCNDCHNNSGGAPYSLNSAPAEEVHSATAMSNDINGSLLRGCGSCHHGPTNNPELHPPQIDQVNPLNTPAIAEGSYINVGPGAYGYAYDAVTDTTTFPTAFITINDPAWSDPSSWSQKTGPERGLMLEIMRPSMIPVRGWYSEILNAFPNNDGSGSMTIVVRGSLDVYLGQPDPEGDLRVFYGQEVSSLIYTNTNAGPDHSLVAWDGSTVKFLGRMDAAQNDTLGVGGNDSTPDGICQVCHTQTKYWRADGSGTDHNDGKDCLGCHEHTNGFLPTANSNGHHPTHMRIKENDGSNTLTCTDCHEQNSVGVKTTITVTNDWLNKVTGGVTNTDTFNPQPIMSQLDCYQWAIDNADGITGTADDYVCVDVIAPVETGHYTCATACHPNTTTPGLTSDIGYGDFSTAALSTLSSPDEDCVVTLDATRSMCDSSDCTITITHTGAVVGGNGGDNIVVDYSSVVGVCTPGTHDVLLTVTDNVNGGVDATAAATVEAIIVEDPIFSGTINVVSNGDGTCTASSADVGNAVRAYIFWGDRTSSPVTDPATELSPPGITHTCGVTVRVTLLDADHLETNLTF